MLQSILNIIQVTIYEHSHLSWVPHACIIFAFVVAEATVAKHSK